MSGTLGLLPPEWRPEPTFALAASPPRRDGTDVARYQWYVDAAQMVAEGGVQWWAHKVSGPKPGQATQLEVDPFHIRNRGLADDVGVRVRLGYHFLIPTVPVSVQAQFYVQNLGGGDGLWQAMVDAEAGGITEASTFEFCDRVEQALGTPTHVYTGVFVAGGSIWKSARLFDPAVGRARILAAYTSEEKMLALCAANGGHQPDVWQWIGDQGRCPGVGRLTPGGAMQSLPCDCDQVYDWSKFDAACGWGHA